MYRVILVLDPLQMVSTKTAIIAGLFCVASLSGCSLFSSPTPAPAPVVSHAVTPAAAAMRDSSQSPDQIKAVQIKLADEGLYAGKVDGTWGPDTSAALSNYQRNHSLEVTGKLNAQTLDAMNATDTPSPTPNTPGPNTPVNEAH
jgi:peptidoglycan hydrolase-like protein with peptidoglycan-binding domain